MSTVNKGKYSAYVLSLVGLLSLMVLLLLPACTQNQKRVLAPLFEFTDQYGQEVSLSSLRGKTVVLTFLYTGCTTVCPLQISKIQQAVSGLGDSLSSVVLVAVTVDPERDTVERLRQYTFQLPLTWSYLTGEVGRLKVMWENYGIYVEKQEGVEGGHQGYDITHTAKGVLIDRDGFIRSELTGEWAVEELQRQLILLLQGKDLPRDFQLGQSIVGFILRCGPVSFTSWGQALTVFVLELIFPLAVVFYLMRMRRGS